jgi:hypothetical protein
LLAFNDADQVHTVTRPDPDGAGPGQPQVTTTWHDTSLRATNVVHPDNTSTYTEHFPNGLQEGNGVKEGNGVTSK